MNDSYIKSKHSNTNINDNYLYVYKYLLFIVKKQLTY